MTDSGEYAEARKADAWAIKRLVAWELFLAATPIVSAVLICIAGGVVATVVYGVPWRAALVGTCLLVLLVLRLLIMMIDVRHRRSTERTRQAIEQMGPVPASESDFPWIDTDSFKEWSFHLSAAGFTATMDSTYADSLKVPFIKMQKTFTRLMIDREKRCFAEISQSRRPGQEAGAVTCSLVSIYESGDDCRTSSAVEPTDPSLKEYRGIFMKSCFYATGASADGLLTAHLEQRDQIAAEQGLTVVDQLSWDVYVDHAKRQAKRVRELANKLVAARTGSNSRV